MTLLTMESSPPSAASPDAPPLVPMETSGEGDGDVLPRALSDTADTANSEAAAAADAAVSSTAIVRPIAALPSTSSRRRRSVSFTVISSSSASPPPSSPSPPPAALPSPPRSFAPAEPVSEQLSPRVALLSSRPMTKSMSRSVSSPAPFSASPLLASGASSASSLSRAGSSVSFALNSSQSAVASSSPSSSLFSSTLSTTLSSLSASVSSLLRSPSPPAPAVPVATFTAAEVAQHNSRSSFWTVCHGRVYDLTHYLSLHPGGFRLLFQHAGGDATADFDALRHSKRAVAILDSYWIGDLVGTRPHRSAPPGLGSAVRTAGGRLGDGLRAAAGVDASRKPLVQGVSATDVIKMQKRVQPVPQSLFSNVSAGVSGFRIQLTPPSSSPRSRSSSAAQPSLPPPASTLSAEAQQSLRSLHFTVTAVDAPYPDSVRVVLTLTAAATAAFPSSLRVSCPSHFTISVPSSSAPDAPLVKRQYTPIACTASSLTLLVRTYSARQPGSFFLSSLSAGQRVALHGPYSSFAHSLPAYRRLVLICMGSGITPVFQLLSLLFASSARQPSAHLLYSARTETAVWLRAEMDAMMQQRPGWTAEYCITQPVDPSSPHRGRLDAAAIRQTLHGWGVALGDGISSSDAASQLFCVCGSDDFTRMVVTALHNCSVPDANIHAF